jgi:hypothetical protein
MLAIAALVSAASGFASTPAPSAKHAIGTVMAYDAKTNVVEVKVGTSIEKFALESATAITDHGATIQAAKLQKGQRVEIEFAAKNGRSIAAKVDVVGSAKPADQKGR